ncbi:hypothetical protein ACIBBG_34185 [Micromonospora chersina]|uniref:hypothetical protein n=1 Tax=Micromonospora chersina TaxID=47854 RepID=UPI0037902440
MAWAAADEAYGSSTVFRAHLREHQLGYVLAVSRSHLVPLDGGKVRLRADRIAAELTDSAWQRRSAGAGSKGPRYYDWAWLDQVTTDADTAAVTGRPGTLGDEAGTVRCSWRHPPPSRLLTRLAHLAPFRQA